MGTGGIVNDHTDVWPGMAMGFRIAVTKRTPLVDRSDGSIALRNSDRSWQHRMAAFPQKRIEV